MSMFTKAIASFAVGAVAVSLAKRFRTQVKEVAPIDKVEPTIELADDYDVTFWMNRFGVSKRKLTSAVKKVGPNIEQLRAHFAQ